MNDNIFALASAKGRSGIAVVRLSGPRAFEIANNIAGSLAAPRRPALRKLKNSDGTVIDEALVLGFEQGGSFTGESVIEFQCHGSPAVVSALLGALSDQEDTRLAEPGEFTRRAFDNGCLDLSQVEGLADLLEAETEAQRKQAYRIMQGELSVKVGAWRKDLVRAAALVEAAIDFADEDIPADVMPEATGLINSVRMDLTREISGSHIAERIRDGFEIAIVGPPNVGKSTLLNTLAGREAAITSEVAGTTRDVIEVRMDLDGLAVTLLDTAGLRESGDVVETLGIDLARKRATSADIRVFLTIGEPHLNLGVEMEPEDIVLRAKSDLRSSNGNHDISSISGAGIDRLIGRITDVLSKRSALALGAVRHRHRLAMERALVNLDQAVEEVESQIQQAELLAMELNAAITALSSLIGKVDVEDLLDEIFSSFCVGK